MATQEDASTINKALADPLPEISSPLPGVVKLARGLQNKDTGEWLDEAEVRELTGRDEEQLDKLRKRDVTYTDFYTEVLKMGLVSIGDVDVRSNPSVVGKLIEADRNTVFLEIIKATYGNTREFVRYCPECGTKNDITVDLREDFPFKNVDVDLRAPIVVETHKGTFNLKLPNGDDLSESGKADTSAEANSVILSKCILWDDDNAPADTLEYVRNMNIKVRKQLFEALLDVEVGPDMGEVDTQCAACGIHMPIAFDWVSLLLA